MTHPQEGDATATVQRVPSPDAEMFEIASWSDMLAAAPPPLAQAVGLEVRTIGGAICVIAPGIPSTEFNRCVGLGVGAAATPDLVDEVIALYRERSVETAWIQIMDGASPPDLGSMLEVRGILRSATDWMVFERVPEVYPLAVDAPLVEEIDQSHAAEAAQVFCEGYGLPPMMQGWVANLVGRPRWRTYCAFEGGSIISTSFLFQDGDRAALAGAGTPAGMRRRGGQTALMRQRISDAAEAGARCVQSHTWTPRPGGPNPSYENMVRAGLHPVHLRRNFEMRRG